MRMSTFKGMLAALLLVATPAAMASTLPTLDYTVNVGIGGGPQFFGGTINEGQDNVWVNLSGSEGTLTAEVTGYVGTGMSLFSWDGGASVGTLIANAVHTGTTALGGEVFSLSSFLAAGSYLLQVYGDNGTVYAGTVSAVPLPGAAILFATALLGAGVVGRKKKQADCKVEAVAA